MPLTAWQIDDKAVFEPAQENHAGLVLQLGSAWALEIIRSPGYHREATLSSRLWDLWALGP